MKWTAVFCDEFEQEFLLFEPGLQLEIAAHFNVVEAFGPVLGRPLVDTVKNSKFANMKELRFTWQRKAYRFFFAFDPQRDIVVLVGGSKTNDKRFYDTKIPVADERFEKYLNQVNHRSIYQH